MEITDRARKLWAWVAEEQHAKSDLEVVSHIALAFVEERQIAFADHGEACAKIAEEKVGILRHTGMQIYRLKKPDEIAAQIRAFSAEVSGLPIEGGER